MIKPICTNSCNHKQITTRLPFLIYWSSHQLFDKWEICGDVPRLNETIGFRKGKKKTGTMKSNILQWRENRLPTSQHCRRPVHLWDEKDPDNRRGKQGADKEEGDPWRRFCIGRLWRSLNSSEKQQSGRGINNYTASSAFSRLTIKLTATAHW